MMDLIALIFGAPLGALMYACYALTRSYGISLILFTLTSKIILLPLSLVTYANSIRLAKIKPRLNDIKRYYSGDKDRIADEQLKLYKAEKYNPFMDLLPLFIQVLLIIGLIHVMYSPMQYLLKVPKDVIEQLTVAAAQLSGAETLGAAAQLKTIDLIRNPEFFIAFDKIYPEWVEKIRLLDISFMGINLGLVPSLRDFSSLLLVPVFSGLSSFFLCVVQNKIHVLQRDYGIKGKWGSAIFFTVFAAYFSFVVPAGMGLYWGLGNLFSIPILMLSNLICKPQKYIDYALRPKPPQIDRATLKANRLREKEDYKRFFAVKRKKIVFYSLRSGVYKYFKNVLDYLMENSDIKIHYVTSDPNDAVFNMNNPQLIPYYIGEKKLISLFMNLDSDMMVMTTPDLHKYHIKRSIVRKDVEYVYMFHAVASTHMIYREGAFNHYDTIFCVGQYHIDEIRATEKKYKLPMKRLIPSGYGLIDNLISDFAAEEHALVGPKKILIAPSWQPDNIMESCLDKLLEQLMGKGYQITVRPHPEFVRRFPEKIEALLDTYKDNPGGDLVIETDFSSNVTIFTADLLITDWSGISFEFSYSTKRPCLLINTPMKVMNLRYKRIKITPIDISLRDKLGISLDMDDLDGVADAVEDLLSNVGDYRQLISEAMEENLFCIGHSGEAGGSYILETLGIKSKEVTMIGKS